MRIAGSLTQWNDDRGFGFITPTQGGPEVFVHISAFPRGVGRPQLGEALSFEIEVGQDGKKRARAVVLATGASALRAKPAARPLRNEHSSRLPRLLILAAAIALGAFGYDQYAGREQDTIAARVMPLADPTPSPVQSQTEASGDFRCDGRTHCSQMSSCAEARYFLKHCPGAAMDGNHDGTPCEQQWCTHAFAR